MKRTRSQASRYAVAKGKDYERRIAKVLSKWWGSTLHRTPTSGVNIYSGDIVDDKGRFPFIVECKKSEQWNLLDLLGKSLPLSVYWSQAYNNYIDGDPHHKWNDPVLLVFSKRGGRDYIMMCRYTLRVMEAYCGNWTHPYLSDPYTATRLEEGMIQIRHSVIGRLDDFIKHFSSDMVKTVPEWRRE